MANTLRLLFLPAALGMAVSCGSDTSNGEWASVDEAGATNLSELPNAGQNAASLLREGAQASAGVIHPLGHDDLCLDVVWGNNRDGTPVQLSKCNGNEAQKWTPVNGMLKVYGDKCLNVTDGSQSNGTRLQIWTCSGNTSTDINNQWKFVNNTIRWAKNDDRCLDVMGGKYSSGNPVQIWDCSGSTGNVNQRWQILGKAAFAGTGATTSTKAPAADTSTANGSKTTTPNFEAGMHIDYDNAAGNSGGVTGFVRRTQIKPKLVANYVRMKNDGSFETGTAKSYADDAANNGAKIISYAVTVEPQTLGTGHLNGLRDSINYARGKGLTVEVRFGYEMNGYWSPPLYDKNSPSVYKKAWAQVAPVVHAAGGFMVWTPNVAGGAPDSYRSWLPDDLTSIDKTGLDYYLNVAQGQQPTVAQVKSILAGVYPVVEQVNQAHANAKTGRTVPFTFGETAVILRTGLDAWGKSVASETELKRKWLVALSDGGLRAQYPLYKGFTWFDYYKTEKEGGTTGNTYHNAFELSQDTSSASMFRTWWQQTGI